LAPSFIDHDVTDPIAWAFGEAADGRSMWQITPVTSLWGRERAEERDWVPECSLKTYPNDIRLSTRFHLLKVPPLPNSIKLNSNSLTHGSSGDPNKRVKVPLRPAWAKSVLDPISVNKPGHDGIHHLSSQLYGRHK
jgi:hypothetical protein